ncbi:hypothetical protein ES689_13325 [Frigoribacterium sp. ACAM 257]|uniref:hypothetical protein n=1 Tax=Frigoribacterium sp. ACAM 257 TaxID=2508998 RepID=UPI0011B9DCD1|nr:hypothetical protein [Frigoribacterium sp. ACAM 257]TWX35559.1 hypothetical protein ES689_13325 [Frigoribacterium sp. ACAM 257]
MLCLPLTLGLLVAPSTAAGSSTTAGQHQTHPGGWSSFVSDKKATSSCLPSDFMVGFKIRGSSIGGDTDSATRCAWVGHRSNGTRVFRGALHKSPVISDKTKVWECPADTAMYQRLHFNKWPGQAQFRCAELIAFDDSMPGGDGTAKLTFARSWWSDWTYPQGEFSCPDGSLLGGVESSMNVTHRFQCRVLA